VGTVKGEGLITIPAWTWKVSVIASRGTRLEDVRDYRDLQVVAVVMPNAPGIRNANWQTEYVVTADSVERLSGYRFLTALPEKTRRALLTGTQPPLASIAPAAGLEGESVAFDAAGSVDPNGSIVSYAWDFGDGTTATGAAATHTYKFFGNYTARLIVTDNDGLADTVSSTVQVAQVSQAQGVAQVAAAATALEPSLRNRGEVFLLRVKVRALEASLARDRNLLLLGQVRVLETALEAMVRSGRLSTAAAQPTLDALTRLRRATRSR
jgi:chitodextrinase